MVARKVVEKVAKFEKKTQNNIKTTQNYCSVTCSLRTRLVDRLISSDASPFLVGTIAALVSSIPSVSGLKDRPFLNEDFFVVGCFSLTTTIQELNLRSYIRIKSYLPPWDNLGRDNNRGHLYQTMKLAT